ncbi:MAG: 2',3'-cyclic-nucleotide 2'-phosphodiesterase (5'-nucleotidase family) [Granulosicoccus sp.]|jgi:2',3'-cyclic-nucleotide 2'-phosphodiesterase (5'-nucleotidase family)
MRLWVLFVSILTIGCSEPEQPVSSWNPISIDSTIVKNSLTEELIAPYRDLIEGEMNRILVKTDTIIYKESPESPLGNLIADLSFERALKECAAKSLSTPDLCLLNFGGLRVNLPEGEILVRKVFELMPFENELVIVELSPDSLTSLIDYLVRVNRQPISNMRIDIDKEENIRKVQIGQKEINVDRNYYVVTTDYLANGGDHMSFFKSPVSRISLDLKLRDAILENFEEVGKTGQSLNPKIDNRITIK